MSKVLPNKTKWIRCRWMRKWDHPFRLHIIIHDQNDHKKPIVSAIVFVLKIKCFWVGLLKATFGQNPRTDRPTQRGVTALKTRKILSILFKIVWGTNMTQWKKGSVRQNASQETWNRYRYLTTSSCHRWLTRSNLLKSNKSNHLYIFLFILSSRENRKQKGNN